MTSLARELVLTGEQVLDAGELLGVRADDGDGHHETHDQASIDQLVRQHHLVTTGTARAGCTELALVLRLKTTGHGVFSARKALTAHEAHAAAMCGATLLAEHKLGQLH